MPLRELWERLAGSESGRTVRDPEIEALLQQDMADAKTLGVRKTPTFIVNGQPLQRFGMRELETLVRAKVEEVYGD